MKKIQDSFGRAAGYGLIILVFASLMQLSVWCVRTAFRVIKDTLRREK